MKKKEIQFAVLFVLLVIPALVFVFMKSFGKNNYEVERYYQTEIPYSVQQNCKLIAFPHRVESLTLNKMQIVLAIRDTIVNKAVKNTLRRIFERYSDAAEVTMVLKQKVSVEPYFNQKLFSAVAWNEYVSCELLTDSIKPKMVLVDQKGMIRGYYDYWDAKEIDRLLLEVEIIKRNTNG